MSDTSDSERSENGDPFVYSLDDLDPVERTIIVLAIDVVLVVSIVEIAQGVFL